MVFSYIDEFGKFQTIVPDLEEIWKKIEDQADEDDFPWDLFEKFPGKIKKRFDRMLPDHDPRNCLRSCEKTNSAGLLELCRLYRNTFISIRRPNK